MDDAAVLVLASSVDFVPCCHACVGHFDDGSGASARMGRSCGQSGLGACSTCSVGPWRKFRSWSGVGAHALWALVLCPAGGGLEQ